MQDDSQYKMHQNKDDEVKELRKKRVAQLIFLQIKEEKDRLINKVRHNGENMSKNDEAHVLCAEDDEDRGNREDRKPKVKEAFKVINRNQPKCSGRLHITYGKVKKCNENI